MAEMEFTSVESTNIDGVHYDDQAAAFTVKFKNGGVYRYEGVSAPIYQEFMDAESKGKYLNSTIKGNFPSTKLS